MSLPPEVAALVERSRDFDRRWVGSKATLATLVAYHNELTPLFREVLSLLVRLSTPPAASPPPAPLPCVVCGQTCDGKWTHVCCKCCGEPPAPVEDDGLDGTLALIDDRKRIWMTEEVQRRVCAWLRELQARRGGK